MAVKVSELLEEDIKLRIQCIVGRDGLDGLGARSESEKFRIRALPLTLKLKKKASKKKIIQFFVGWGFGGGFGGKVGGVVIEKS